MARKEEKLKPLSDFDRKCLMPKQAFIDDCKAGFFMDYDGFGYYATGTHKTHILANPSDIIKGQINQEYQFVVWYNS